MCLKTVAISIISIRLCVNNTYSKEHKVVQILRKKKPFFE